MTSSLYLMGALMFCFVAELHGAAVAPPTAAWCSGTGDPHLKTYDGLNYDFHGYGEDCLYIMSELCVPGNLHHFQVLTRHMQCVTQTQVSCIEYAEVKVFGLTVRIDGSSVEINGVSVTVPLTYPRLTNWLSITSSAQSTILLTSFGLKVKTTMTVGRSWMDVRVWLPASYANRVCGLCGNYNGESNDDTITINGFDECKDPGALSWIVPNCACGGKKDPKCWKPCRKFNDRSTIFVGVTRRNLEVVDNFFEIANIQEALRNDNMIRDEDFEIRLAALQRNAAFDLDHKAPRYAVFETIAGEVEGANDTWRAHFTREKDVTTQSNTVAPSTTAAPTTTSRPIRTTTSVLTTRLPSTARPSEKDETTQSTTVAPSTTAAPTTTSRPTRTTTRQPSTRQPSTRHAASSLTTKPAGETSTISDESTPTVASIISAATHNLSESGN